MSAPKPAEDGAEPSAPLDASAARLAPAPGQPSDEAEATTVWVIAKPQPAEPGKADAT